MIACGVALLRAIFYKPVLLEGFGYYTWFVADGLSMGAFLALIVRRPGFTRDSLKKIALGSMALWATVTVTGAASVITQNRPMRIT